jgi:hypothetical protein
MTLVEFAVERGLLTTADVDAHIHGGLRSKPQTKSYQRWYDKKLIKLQRQRDATTAAYLAAVAAGEVLAFGRLERLIATASGHPDNESVQAARRLLVKHASAAKATTKS